MASRATNAAEEPEPQPDTSAVTTEPEQGKPVVLATSVGATFVLPGAKPEDDVVVTAEGVALSASDAKKVRDAATTSGVELIEIKKGDS